MRHSNLYYKDIFLGTLYEDGTFIYTLSSSQSREMDIETIVHVLENVRESGLSKTFDYDKYMNDWSGYPFKDGFDFR